MGCFSSGFVLFGLACAAAQASTVWVEKLGMWLVSMLSTTMEPGEGALRATCEGVPFCEQHSYEIRLFPL